MIFRSCNLPIFPIICGYFGNIFKTAFVSLNHNFTHDFRFKIIFCTLILHFMGFILFSCPFLHMINAFFADQIRFLSPAASNPACKTKRIRKPIGLRIRFILIRLQNCHYRRNYPHHDSSVGILSAYSRTSI